MTLSEDDFKLFGGGRFSGQRLRTLGVGTHLAVLSFRPSLGPGVQTHIAEQVIRSQRHLSLKAISEILAKRKDIEVKRLSVTGRAWWLKTIRPWRGGGLRASSMQQMLRQTGR